MTCTLLTHTVPLRVSLNSLDLTFRNSYVGMTSSSEKDMNLHCTVSDFYF